MLLALAPALIIISLSALDRRHKAILQTENNVSHLVESLALHQESLVLSTRQFLATLGEIPAIQQQNTAATQTLLSQLHRHNRHYANFLAADLTGYVYANAIGVPGFSIADRKYFKEILTTPRFTMGEFVISRSTKRPVLSYAAPVFNRAGQLTAVMVAGLDLTHYDTLLTQTQLPNGTTITLTDHQGTVLHRLPQGQIKPGATDPNFGQMQGTHELELFRTTDNSAVQINAWKRLRLSDDTPAYLYIRVALPESEAGLGIVLVALRDIGLLLLVAALALLITWAVGNRGIVQPIRLLATAAEKVGKGVLDTRVPHVSAPQELEQLVSDFNSMTATLEERERQQKAMLQELKASEEKYRIVADYTLDWEYWLGPDGLVLYMSPATLELTGYHRDEFYADPALLNSIFHPDDREWMAGHTAHPDTDGPLHGRDVKIITRQGEERWIAHICQPVTDSTGHPMGRRGCNRDITDRKRAELSLQQKSNELAELNRTLQERVSEELHKNREKDRMLIAQGRQAAMGEMISNIAHQWRQPLNNLALMIQGLVIDYDYGELNREELEKSVQHGMELILFMSSTIDDFRNFFKPNRVKSCFKLETVTHQAISFVSANLEEQQIEVQLRINHELTSFGYPNECTQVLINLLGNARDALLERQPEQRCIIITLDNSPAGPTITVQDNGGGIPEEILDRVFDPYFTTKEQGKGTGIGLYMAKTIIEKNMGGTITASNQNSGALFTITLPSCEDALAESTPPS